MAIEGAFNGAPYLSNNLPEYLEGAVDATFWTYKNISAARDLFIGVYPEAFVTIGKLLQNTASPVPVTVVLSNPEDQDFDFQNILRKPGMVFELQLVRVKEGKETEYQETREKLVTLARNTNNVESKTKFEVNRDGVKDEMFGLRDLANMELTITVYKSMNALNKDRIAMKENSDFEKFIGTFDCIMCATMIEQSRPEYFPPFD